MQISVGHVEEEQGKTRNVLWVSGSGKEVYLTVRQGAGKTVSSSCSEVKKKWLNLVTKYRMFEKSRI